MGGVETRCKKEWKERYGGIPVKKPFSSFIYNFFPFIG
jgi:hypothetical protein